jgi:hypothetical protein
VREALATLGAFLTAQELDLGHLFESAVNIEDKAVIKNSFAELHHVIVLQGMHVKFLTVRIAP